MKPVMIGAVALLLAVSPIAAQKNAPKGKKGAAAPEPVDTTPPPYVGRLSWTSDRRPLRVGDLITIVVDEQTAANETSINQAHLDRSQQGTLNGDIVPSKLKSLGTTYDASSDGGATAGRTGDLTSVLSVRVTRLEPGGIAHVAGEKAVTVDGRKQNVGLTGVIRAEDIAADNTVQSNRVADAVITYQGKKMGPTTGIIGKILAILWP